CHIHGRIFDVRHQENQEERSTMKQKPFILAGVAACLAGVPLASLSTPALAVDFAGKTLEFIIPFGVAGGSDKWARFYAPLMSKALPGHPVVVVKNEPGARSL